LGEWKGIWAGKMLFYLSKAFSGRYDGVTIPGVTAEEMVDET